MKLLVLGSDGMVGHVVKRYFIEQKHNVIGYTNNHPAFSDTRILANAIRNCSYDAVINCTAVINREAEMDKVAAVKFNALLPHFLEAVTAMMPTVIVHRSTDCIFSGRKGNYTLEDWPDAASFYARSKALGELDNEKDITIRTSLIGPETDKNGRGLFNWFYRQCGEVSGFANSIWTGITTIELAKEIEQLLIRKAHGVFQLVPSRAISKYELLLLFEKYYPGNRKIKRVDNTWVDKSLVPNTGKIVVPNYEPMIAGMRQWTDEHKDIYDYE